MFSKHFDRDLTTSQSLLNVGSFLAVSLAAVILMLAISIVVFFALWQRNQQVENYFLNLIAKFNIEETFVSAARSLSQGMLYDKNFSAARCAHTSKLLVQLLNGTGVEKALQINDTPWASIFDVIKLGDLPPSADSVQMAAMVSRFMIFDAGYWHDGKSKEQTFLIAANGSFAAFAKDIYVPRNTETLRTEVETILARIKQAIADPAAVIVGPIWTKRYVHPLTGKETLTCFSPVYDRQGRIVAYVGTNVNPGDLLGGKDTAKLAHGETIQLVTQAGVVAASAGHLSLRPSHRKGAFTVSFFDGSSVSVNLTETTISFERPVRSINWNVIYAMKMQYLFNAYVVIFFLLTLIFFSFAIAIFFGNRFIRLRIIAPARQRTIALEESEEFVRGVINTAPVGLAVIDPTVPRLLISNPIYDHGINLNNVFGPTRLADLHHQLRNERPGLALTQSLQESLANGDRRFYSVTASQQTLHDMPVLIFAVSDITEQKHVEAELLASRNAIESANRAKDDFLAVVSHEIRTPLYGALASLELLAATSLRESQRYLLDVMESSTRNLLELINDLLDFSKIEVNKFTLSKRDVHLIPELEAVGRACATRARLQNITFDWMLDPALSRAVTTDAVRLAQIVTNLVSNAIKFTLDGYVALTVTLEAVSEHYCYIAINVRDSGIGIALPEMANLFKPFSQIGSHEVHASGTGLGLSISRKLAALFDGEIRVDSEKGKGSSFTFTCNLFWAEAALPRQQSSGSFAYHTNTARRRWYLQSLIRQAGFTPVPNSKESNADASISGVIAFADEADEIEAGSKIVLIASNAPESNDKIPPLEVLHVCAFKQAQILDCIRGKNSLPDVRPIPDTTSSTASFAFRALVVDDHPVNATILAGQLETLGCMADIYNDPREALAAFEPDFHQLILTDMNMPGMSGEQFAARAREIAEYVPVIAVTANAALGAHADRPAIFDAVIVKPFTSRQLAAAFDTLMGRGVLKFKKDNVEVPAKNGATWSVSANLRKKMIALADADLEQCSLAAQVSDVSEVVRLAHRLRGAFSVVGMHHLASLCARLESSVQSRDVHHAQLLLADINQEWRRTRDFFLRLAAS